MTATKSKPYIYEGGGSAIDDYQAPKNGVSSSAVESPKNWGEFNKRHPLYKVHQYIFSLCITKEWSKSNEKHGVVADTYKLGEFFKSKYSPVNKPLMDMTKPELEKIIVALGGVVVHHWNKKK